MVLNEANWRIIFNDPSFREMEFGDAYDNIPPQVQPLPGKAFQMKTIISVQISANFFQDRNEFISDFGHLFAEQPTGTNCHFAMVLAKKY